MDTYKNSWSLFSIPFLTHFDSSICQKENINQVKYHVVVNKISIQIFYLHNPMSLSLKNTSLISRQNLSDISKPP